MSACAFPEVCGIGATCVAQVLMSYRSPQPTKRAGRKEDKVIVSDVMTTALVTGAPDDLVDEVLYEMKLASIRHLPIVGDNGRMVGIVSDRDVLLSLGTNQSQTVHLRDIMSKAVETVTDGDDVTTALTIMLEKKIGCLPVLGAKGQLVGVVTETDFLHVAHSLLSDEDIGESKERWEY